MKVLSLIYKYYCKLEELIVQAILCIITLLVFISAVLRTIGSPINWAVDLSLLLFAWLIFLGASVSLRSTELVAIDMVVKKLPGIIQDGLYILWTGLSLAFLGMLIRFGIPLAIESYARPFYTLGISFSYATISVSVGSASMMLTMVVNAFKHFKTPKEERYARNLVH